MTKPDLNQIMQPFPGLENYATSIRLPQSGLELFVYDSHFKTAPTSADSAATEDLSLEELNAKGRPEPPLILLLHGLGDEADTWRGLFEPLASKGRAIAPDLPGFGRSAKPKTAYTLDFYTSVVLELLDQFTTGKVILIGHSLGGVITQMFALLHPERVSSLVLIDGGLAWSEQRLDAMNLLFLLPCVGEYMYNRLRKDEHKAYATLAPYYGDLEQLSPAAREFLRRRVVQRVWDDAQRHAYFSTLRRMVLAFFKLRRSIPPMLAESKIHTLVIWQEGDTINPVGNGRALAQMQPSARLVILPGQGHMPHQQQPQEVLQAILADERLNLIQR